MFAVWVPGDRLQTFSQRRAGDVTHHVGVTATTWHIGEVVAATLGAF